MNPKLGYVILAAGKGTRMHSDAPKVLQDVLGKPLLGYVYDALREVPPERVWTVVGYKAEAVQRAFPSRQAGFVIQEEQLGTGHAVALTWPAVTAGGVSHVCVLNGDTPHVPLDDIKALADACASSAAAMGLLTLNLTNPFGYGRVVRGENGEIERIVEEKDFVAADHGGEIHEVNSGVYVFDVIQCGDCLQEMDRNNAQGEFYLTQMISICARRGLEVVGVPFGSSDLLRGVNSPRELVRFEDALRADIVASHLDAGVIVRQAGSVVIGPDVLIEPGAEIAGPCELYGSTLVARGARIASHC